MKSEIKITKVVQDIYCIEEMDYKEHCNCYFIVGEEKCLLVDFGIGLIDFEIILSKISYGKEIIKVLTHFHFDHFGGAFNFGKMSGSATTLPSPLATGRYSLSIPRVKTQGLSLFTARCTQ